MDYVYFSQKNTLNRKERTLHIESHNETFSNRVIIHETCCYSVSSIHTPVLFSAGCVQNPLTTHKSVYLYYRWPQRENQTLTMSVFYDIFSPLHYTEPSTYIFTDKWANTLAFWKAVVQLLNDRQHTPVNVCAFSNLLPATPAEKTMLWLALSMSLAILAHLCLNHSVPLTFRQTTLKCRSETSMSSLFSWPHCAVHALLLTSDLCTHEWMCTELMRSSTSY